MGLAQLGSNIKKIIALGSVLCLVALPGCLKGRKPSAARHILTVNDYIASVQVTLPDGGSEACWRIIINMPSPPRVMFTDFASTPMYLESEDTVTLPSPDLITSAEEFIAAWLHEYGHSTKHVTRLNRKLPRYAEEIVAELIAITLMEHCGLSDKRWSSSFDYVRSWLDVMRDIDQFLTVDEYLAFANAGAQYILRGHR